MKKITQIILLLSLCCIQSWGQKKYEMVVEKTDGTETVINVEDIVRTFFRERSGSDNTDNVPAGLEAVDLGLPSGTKWANMNVGATTPEGIGGYYAWGETSTKANYVKATYSFANGSDGNYVSLGDAINGTEYDVAHMLWGGSWEMPTKEDFAELFSNCTLSHTSLNGVYVTKVTGPNGNSIVIPRVGGMVGTSLSVKAIGLYWTSMQNLMNPNEAYVYYIPGSSKYGLTTRDRAGGYSIRPVIGHRESDPVPGPSDNINIQQLFGKWVCYYQQWTFNGEITESNYTTDDYYINLGTDYSGVICSQNDELFEWGTGGYEKNFTWSVSGESIRYLEETGSQGSWEIVSQSEDYLTLRWVGGTNGNYIIVARFVRNHIDSGGETPTPATPSNVEAVDLGLSVKWASCNVGASSPEDYGGYYAWGETETKTSYFDYNYKYCTSETSYIDIGSDISGTQYDVAHVTWGGTWRMPTAKEFNELNEKCTTQWTTVNGVYGTKVTGPNGNSIFLPAGGRNYATSGLRDEGEDGWFWTSNLENIHAGEAAATHYGIAVQGRNRINGCNIRPVCDNDGGDTPGGDTPGGDTPQPQPGEGDTQTFTVNGVTFNMIPVEGGTFQMGSTDSDAYSDESPVHSVTLSSFCIGETEVTQALWYAVMGQKPTSDGYQWSSTYGLGDNRPAYYISWNDCQEFITKLNQLTGKQFRLPTEAEWEFAARGGNKSNGYKYAGSNTIEDVAWYTVNSYDLGSSNANYGTHNVGTKQANELGIYDMSGNVWEWCSDWYGSYSSTAQTNPTGPTTGSLRVFRGGSWISNARNCRVSLRSGNAPGNRSSNLGLRLAL